MAVADGHGNFAASLRTAARRSSGGMLGVALVPVAVLLLGVVKVVDDDTAIWPRSGSTSCSLRPSGGLRSPGGT
jgi:hypothetical protein